ncbi:hypothetical protein EDB86DRAFT_2836124 [Lactarius hatsudake]|nr:hypothetical protein EDB86DRAFT_2836124 [Lactarius hatsudake]
MGGVCGFDHQIQDRVEYEGVMESDKRQVGVVADEVISDGGKPTQQSKKGRRPQKPRKDQKEAPSAYRSLKPVEEENSNQLVADLEFFPSRSSLPFREREEVEIGVQCSFPATVPKPGLYEWEEREWELFMTTRLADAARRGNLVQLN